jgi:hypothetical protein
VQGMKRYSPNYFCKKKFLFDFAGCEQGQNCCSTNEVARKGRFCEYAWRAALLLRGM